MIQKLKIKNSQKAYFVRFIMALALRNSRNPKQIEPFINIYKKS